MRAIPGRSDPTSSPRYLLKISRLLPEIGYNACTPDFRSTSPVNRIGPRILVPVLLLGFAVKK
jgi:hypothetical protein